MNLEADSPSEGTSPSGLPKGIAAFDFDGTLTLQDTMLPFLPRTHGWPRVTGAALLSLPRASLYTARVARPLAVRELREGFRDGLKVATVGRLFRGMALTELEELGRAYAETLREVFRPEMLDRVRWHQGEGHATVIVSASLAVYLRPVAKELGIDDVLGVELTSDSEGVLTGDIDGGLNTRGPHKVTRLRDWIHGRFSPGTAFELWAYGDSSGDTELLTVADHPTWVR